MFSSKFNILNLLRIILCALYITIPAVGYSAETIEAPVLSIKQIGSTITLYWPSITGAKGYKFFYAPYPNTDLFHSFVAETQEYRFGYVMVKIKPPSSFAYNIAVQALSEDGESPLSDIHTIGIQMSEKIVDIGNDGTVDAKIICVFNLKGNLLKESRDMNLDGVYEKTINYEYETIFGLSLIKTEETELAENVWYVKHYSRWDNIVDVSDDGGKVWLKNSHTYYGHSLVVKTKDYTLVYALGNSGDVHLEQYDRGNDGFPEELYQYDEDGFLVSNDVVFNASSGGYTSIFMYDGIDNLVKEERLIAGALEPFKRYLYSYDTAGRKISESIDAGMNTTARVTTFFYDETGRLIREDVDTDSDGVLDEINVYVYY